MSVRVSSTAFFRFLASQSTTRVAKVREAKRMMEASHEDYPRIDYWKPLRDSTIQYLTGAIQKEEYSKRIAATSDSKKIANYRAAAMGINKWMGRRQVEASVLSSRVWSSSQLEVSVTPELKISWEGSPTYVMKLYFSADPISKYLANPMLRLLECTHGRLGTVAILDAQRGRIHVGPTARPDDLDILLRTEAAAFVSVWMAV